MRLTLRIFALPVLLSALFSVSVHAQRTDSSPLVKAPQTVKPCLAACESEFAACEAEPQATTMLCPQARRVCFERCDPAVLSSETLKGLKRTPEELRAKPLNPQTPVERCRQTCQDRRALCLADNASGVCESPTQACYQRCESVPPAAHGKP